MAPVIHGHLVADPAVSLSRSARESAAFRTVSLSHKPIYKKPILLTCSLSVDFCGQPLRRCKGSSFLSQFRVSEKEKRHSGERCSSLSPKHASKNKTGGHLQRSNVPVGYPPSQHCLSSSYDRLMKNLETRSDLRRTSRRHFADRRHATVASSIP